MEAPCRRETRHAISPQLVGVFAAEHACLEVFDLLGQVGFQLAAIPPQAVAELPAGAGPILVQVEGTRGHPFDWWAGMRRSGIGPWIGVHSAAAGDVPIGLGGPSSPPASPVPTAPLPFPCFSLPSQQAMLVTRIRRAWVDALERRVGLGLRARSGTHICVVSAVRRLLRQRPRRWTPMHPEVTVRGGRSGFGLLAWLAEEIRISPDHLSRLAREAEVPLWSVHDAWRLVLALVVRMELGSWDGAARELGMRGGTGLAAVRRALGHSPKELAGDWGRGLGAAEGHLANLLPGEGAQKSEPVEKAWIV